MSGTLHHSLLNFIEESEQVGTWSCELAPLSVYWSPNLFNLLGLEPGRTTAGLGAFEQIVHPEDQEQIDRMGNDELGGPVGEHEFRIIRPNGTIRWLRTTGQLLHRPDGKAWRAVGFVRDITDERDAQVGHAALEGTRQALRKLAGGEIWINTVRESGADGSLWGSGSPWKGRSLAEDIHPDDVTRVGAAWARALAERRPFRSAYRMNAGSGRYERYVSYAEPIEDERRRSLGWVGVTLPDVAPDSEMVPAKNIPGPLLRAARGWLNLSVLQLADRSGLSSSTIRRLEGGGGRQATRDSEQTLLRTFHEAGIDFYVDGSGEPQVRFSRKRPRKGADGKVASW